MFKSKFSKLLISIIIAVVVLLLILSYIGNRTPSSKGVTSKLKPGEAIAVSDVDAHSQSQMKVKVEGERVTAIQGDPSDPESKGELNIRDKKMDKILYAPDRLKYPIKRVGQKGEGK